MSKINKWIIGLAILVLIILALSQPKSTVKTDPVEAPSVESVEPAEQSEAVTDLLEPTPNVMPETTAETESVAGPEKPISARPRTYTLGRIIDGDTFIALDVKGNEIKIRMAGIDAPESNQVFGKESAEYLDSLLQDPFTLRFWDKDRYDREIATVLVHDVDINQDMVLKGYAWSCDYYRKGPSYNIDQDEARAEGRGLWHEKSTLPPQYFRKISGHGEFGHELLKGGFYLWDGVIHNHNCPGKVDAAHSWNGLDDYENCPKCGGLIYD